MAPCQAFGPYATKTGVGKLKKIQQVCQRFIIYLDYPLNFALPSVQMAKGHRNRNRSDTYESY
jgi:hypothetical protein